MKLLNEIYRLSKTWRQLGLVMVWFDDGLV